MKIKKVVSTALMLSLSITLSACVLENKSSDTESTIEIVYQSDVYEELNCMVTILRDNETGVEYVYILRGQTGGVIYPRLDKDGNPVVSR